MKNRKLLTVFLVGLICGAVSMTTACGAKTDSRTEAQAEVQEEADSASTDEQDAKEKTDAETDASAGEESETAGANNEKSAAELLQAFLNNEIPAETNGASTYIGEDQTEFYLKDLPYTEDTNDWEAFSAGGWKDLDNDGEEELILNGPYGGMYLDAADGKVSVLASGEGTASVLMYGKYDHVFWVVHADTMHAGREIYHMDRYIGGGNIQESCELSAEFENSPDDTFHEDSTFMFRGEQISMEEFQKLKDEIFAAYYSAQN